MKIVKVENRNGELIGEFYVDDNVGQTVINDMMKLFGVWGGEVADRPKVQQEPTDFKSRIMLLRTLIRGRAKQLQEYRQTDYCFNTNQYAQDSEYKCDFHEMEVNMELAYRHLEDAVMRLGKAIQAYDGGSSVYDK